MAEVIPIKFSKKLLEKFGDAVADWWNSAWGKTTVYYPIDGVTMTDPRTLLEKPFEPTPKLQSFLDLIKDEENDEKAYQIHRWIMRDFGGQYKSDLVVWHKTEKWQTPQETLEMQTYDCEDVSLLWMKLAMLVGIPAYRRKIYCGDVPEGGHAYPCYLTEEGNRWVSMDLTYYARVLRVENRAAQSDIRYYGRVWWTFNETHIWTQHDTVIRS